MLKKALYLIMGGLFIFFIYNNYIKEDKIEIRDVNENVQTENIRYNVGKNYEIEAENLIENKENENTYFKTAKAIFDTLKISGKEAIVDKYQNMVLEGDILGETNSGWDFTTEKINYDEKKEKFYSESKIIAKNPEEKMNLVADKFDANSGFTVINLVGDVKLQTPTLELTSKRVRYDRENKMVRFTTNIRFKAKNLESGKGTIDRISGRMNSAIYDLERGKLTVWGKFEIYYMGYVISANNMMYYKETGNVNIYDNVQISKEDIEINMRKMYYNDNTEKIVLTGPITGNKGNYEFESAYGDIETKTENEKIRILQDVVITNEENQIKLFADEVKYDLKSSKLDILGNRQIKLEGEEFTATSKNAKYDLETNVLTVDEDYEFIQDNLKILGNKLDFNTETEMGNSQNNKLRNQDLKMESSFLEFNLSNKEYILRENVKVEREDYILNTENMIINNKEGKILIPEEFEVNSQKENFNLIGINGEFQNINNEDETRAKKLIIKDSVDIQKDDFFITANMLDYNLDEETGQLEGDLNIKNEKQGIDIDADRGTYKKGGSLVLYDDIDIKKDNNKLNTEKMTYKTQNEKLIFDNPGEITNEEKNYKINYEKGNYQSTTEILNMDNVKGQKDDIYIESDYAKYDSENELLTLTENVKIIKENIVITGSEMTYDMTTSDIESNSKVNIKKENVLIVANYVKINMNSEYLESEDVVVTTDQGDRLSGNKMFGKLSNMEFDFVGDLQADLTNNTSFYGDRAKMFFVENDSDEYEVTRGEINDNTRFIYGQMDLTADYLEIDNNKNLVFGKGNPKLKVQESTEVVSEYIYLELDKKVGRMENNVKMTNKGIEEAGTVNATSDKAILRNEERKIEFLGNVEVYKGQNTVQTDKGTMDLDTNVLSGVGNTKFKLSADKKEEGD
ncbi:MAG: LPS export ABC transporter periplasmic protein LptC [Fusobacteriota bacterium]